MNDDELTLNIEECEPTVPATTKRKTSEAAKRAQAKWRKTHADRYKEKCREHSLRYYARHHDEILAKLRSKNAEQRRNVIVSTVLI